MLASVHRLPVVTSLFLVLGAMASLCAGSADEAPIERFHRVDARLYRGAQPDVRGFRHLKDLGVRTVINLREEADAIRLDEQRIVEELGMRYVNLPVKDGNMFRGSHRIPDDIVRRFFAAIDRAEPGPVFVHCRRGADRTGALVGMYRVARNGWDGARAFAEARKVGMRFWYRGFRRQIEEFGADASAYSTTPVQPQP